MNDIFKNSVKAEYFFKNYAPNVKSWRKKMIGKNTNGNPIDFTLEDKKEMKAGLKRLLTDMMK